MIKKTYSFEKDNQINDVYTLSNANGCEVDILTYGARIIRVSVPDKDGRFGDVIVGCKIPEDYYGDNPYCGAIIGRVGNRIGGASFVIDGQRYQLEKNEGENCLHGGVTATFDRQIWGAEIVENTLVLTLVSPDGAGGFPGEMTTKVSYTFTDENELIIEYNATSTKDTACNLTNHAYFNIGEQDTVLSHELMIKSRKITTLDKEMICRGDYTDIDNTPYSFYTPKQIGKDMFSQADMIKRCKGFDFNYCLERETEHDLEHCAYVYDSVSGRRLDCFTTTKGMQLYTANFTGGLLGKKAYVDNCAVCLETQGYPNAINCPSFPSSLLKAGEKYYEKTVYKFSVVNAQ